NVTIPKRQGYEIDEKICEKQNLERTNIKVQQKNRNLLKLL
ncbi:8489_t:CDS:1, partial [Racocetra persica]